MARKQPPKLGAGLYWRRNTSGWDLRKAIPGRKFVYVAHLSATKWKEMTTKNRDNDDLRKALETWVLGKLQAKL